MSSRPMCAAPAGMSLDDSNASSINSGTKQRWRSVGNQQANAAGEELVYCCGFAVAHRCLLLSVCLLLLLRQFLCGVLQLELDRINFLLISYHRCRLKKLEKYAAHLLFSREAAKRCSKHEQVFLNGSDTCTRPFAAHAQGQPTRRCGQIRARSHSCLRCCARAVQLRGSGERSFD